MVTDGMEFCIDQYIYLVIFTLNSDLKQNPSMLE